jgi:hypothetical protein
MSLHDMVTVSSAIVHGTVIAQSSRWNDDRSLVVTDVRIRVTDALKGAPGDEILVTQPGGVVGKLRVDVPGAAVFQPGQETVLFLKPTTEGRTIVTGLFLGRFDVTEDPRTGAKTVRGLEDQGLTRLGKPGDVQVLGHGAAVGGPVPVDDFLSTVRALVRDVDAQGGK